MLKNSMPRGPPDNPVRPPVRAGRTGAPASCASSWSRAVLSAVAFGDAGGLLHGEGASSATDPGAGLSVPQDLVDDERHTNGPNHAQGDKGWNHGCHRDQPEQHDRRDGPASPQPPADPQPQPDVRQQVQGDPATQANGGDAPERTT